MDFREATDDLFHRVAHEDLARALGVSVATIRQARLNQNAEAHRSPPAEWKRAIIRLAHERMAEYGRLIERLSEEVESKSRRAVAI